MPGWSTACFGSFKKAGDSFYNKNSWDTPQIEDKIPSTLSDDKKGTSIVELEKKDGVTLGLIISGGIDKNTRPRVSHLRPGSIAHRCDAIAVGDYIVSVNGIRTCKLKHEEIVNLLKNAGSKVTLEVEYEIPVPFGGRNCVTSKVIQIKLDKEKESFGFTLRGGVCVDKEKSRPLTITHVRFGGPADRVGIIKAGDRLVAIDGINLSSASLQDALQFLKQLKQSAIFTIEYDVSCIDAVKHATGPLLIEIDKTPGCLLGISLSCLSVPEHAIVIESIRQGSIAERCGALHVGDHILAIDDIKVDLMTSAEAMQLLRSSMGETVKLEILPVGKIALRNPSESCNKRGGVPSLVSSPYASAPTAFSPRRSSEALSAYNTILSPAAHCSSDGVSLNSNSNAGSSTIAHADRTEVTLHADHKGFGFTLQGSSYPSDILTTPPYVSSIEQGSPAERCGVLQVGDRVLAVNGESTEGFSLEEITNMISSSHLHVTLITEFDVAEAVVPSSGTFIVKLVKRDVDLGILLTAPRNRQLGEPLTIADIKKGSVAHRTGSIQLGDKLLAINSLRTENCTVEEATAFLHTSIEIVKLRIRKDETFSEDPDSTCSIIYTVELVRHGGPLGITVSGTKEPFDPIFISGLTENGLAERTGALHIGDRILAINGTSLRGKTLNEAICILQTCGDAVTLKISKYSCSDKSEEGANKSKCIHCLPDSRMKTFSTPIPSIDSAVDSWDSCNPGLASDVANLKSSSYDNANQGHISTSYPNTLEFPQYKKNNDSRMFWEPHAVRRNSFSGSRSVQSEEEKESWNKVLEDLQTCGQSRLLRQLEESLLGLDENAADEQSPSESFENRRKNSDTLSEQNLEELNSQIQQLDIDLQSRDSFPPANQSNNEEFNYRQTLVDGPNVFCGPSSSFSAPLPIEIHKVTLFKDQVYEDFGFSLSDGKYEDGVYINSIRPGGPADLSGLIKPLDRILQVNNVKTFNAGLIVPLIASSGDRIELVISRPAYDNDSSSEDTLGRASNYNHWLEDDGDKESTSPYPIFETKIYTKTL